MKENIKTKKTYLENEVVVILEDIKSQFMAFGEGQNLLSDKVDVIETKVDVIDERLSKVETKVDVIDERLSKVETKVDVIDERLSKIETKVDVIDERLVRIEDDVVEIKHKLSEKVDLKDFQKLEKRFLKLEKIVFEKI